MRLDLPAFDVTDGGNRHRQIPIAFEWNPEDPLAVEFFLYPDGATRVEWAFAYTLLAEGLVRPMGEGDVRVGRDSRPECLIVELASPAGYIALETVKGPVRRWVGDVASQMPLSVEHLIPDDPSGFPQPEGWPTA